VHFAHAVSEVPENSAFGRLTGYWKLIPVTFDRAIGPSRKFRAAHRGSLIFKTNRKLNGLRLCLSLMNELHRCARRARHFKRKFQRPQKDAARSAMGFGFLGSLSFVAVVQPTDLRHRHNRPHFWRLNRSWLR